VFLESVNSTAFNATGRQQIPIINNSANISTRAAEIDNTAAWAADNLKPNKCNTKEVIFRDNR